jgi:hypothetical protein
LAQQPRKLQHVLAEHDARLKKLELLFERDHSDLRWNSHGITASPETGTARKSLESRLRQTHKDHPLTLVLSELAFEIGRCTVARVLAILFTSKHNEGLAVLDAATTKQVPPPQILVACKEQETVGARFEDRSVNVTACGHVNDLQRYVCCFFERRVQLYSRRLDTV